MSTLPEWIADPVLQPAWHRVRARFEKAGLNPQGKVLVTAGTREERHVIGALLGRTITSNSVRIDLATLDTRLRERSGIGGLEAVLTALYGRRPEDRPAVRAARDESRERPLAIAAELSPRRGLPSGSPACGGPGYSPTGRTPSGPCERQ